jgi:DNA-binding response OmpR family regulator
LVDDQEELRILTKSFLMNSGYTVEAARSVEEALVLFDPKVHDIVVTNNSMPGMSGAEMAHIVRLRSLTTPILMFSERSTDNLTSADLVLQKPVPLATLRESVELLLVAAP